MPRFDFDLFTIGAGSGGVAASRRAGGYGARVAIAERDRIGGTCVLRGCVPKKLLVYATHLREAISDAVSYGWSMGEPALDWGKLVINKNAELDRLEGIYERMLANAGVRVVTGRAVVVDPHTVEVDGQRFTSERILLAPGAWPTLPADIEGVEHAMTSNEALDLEAVPDHVTVVGGGYIGVEFAGIFSGAGVRVTQIIRAEQVLRGFDDDVRSALGEELRARGIELLCEEHVRRIERAEGRLLLTLSGGEQMRTDAVLCATGRHPNTAGLGLPEVGVELDDDGAIVVDAWSRTAVPSLWAVGDATNRLQLTPVAIADGRAFAETEFNDNPTPVDHEAVPSAVFSQPPVATVGLSEAQAREQGHEVDVYRTRFRPMQHVLPDRETRTMMKLVVDRESDRVLGVHMVGDDAPEIVQGFAVALRCGATKKQFDATVGIHPTSAEELVTMPAPVK
jgi:glutathione reductase (NADPH)